MKQIKQAEQKERRGTAELMRERRIAAHMGRIEKGKAVLAGLEEERRVLLLTDLTGIGVAHKLFGSGVIEDSDRGTVTVRFSQGSKRFVLPDAFLSGHLTGEDERIETLLREYRRLIEGIRETRKGMEESRLAMQNLVRKAQAPAR